MKRLPTIFALVIAGTGLAACQGDGGGQRFSMLSGGRAPSPAATPMEGRWASTDGIFVASFNNGNFTSIDAKTDAVLAEGSYTVSGQQVQMNWLSTGTGERRSATCSFSGGRSQVSCVQPSGGSFTLRRT